jgi:ferric-dicitrate binding protein FerR (iron transport regulator)
MDITRNVVKDLLLVYEAGEASSDTRAIVEEWLRRDPELARDATRAAAAAIPVPPPVPATAEKQALDRTKRQLRRRFILLGTAVYVTTLLLSVTFNSQGFTGLLIDNWPERIVVWAIAALLWWLYWRASRRLSVAGF